MPDGKRGKRFYVFLAFPNPWKSPKNDDFTHSHARLLPHYNDISALHQHNCTRYRCPLGTFWAHSKIALGRYCKDDSYMAEGEGFEPPLPFRVKRFSRPPVSTTHTSLRGSVINSLTAVRHSQNRWSFRPPVQSLRSPSRMMIMRGYQPLRV